MTKGQAKTAKGAERPAPKSGRGDRGSGTPWLTRRQRRRLGWAVGGLAVVLVVAGGGWLYARMWGPPPGEFVPSLGNDHIESTATLHRPYNSDPPTSGPHLPYIAPWGVHTTPIPRELQVHNLEDGGVVVNYRPDCADQVLASLRSVVARYSERVLLAPYPGLDRCVALTAWTRIEKFDQLDEGRVVRFIDAYRGIDHHPR